MIEIALYFALICFGLGELVCLYRIAFAPSVGDRILALDTMTINMIALIALFGILHDTKMYFEVMMLFALTGFISTVAFAKFILRGDVVE